ncbi:DUF58 domain-containing protein [Bacillus solimangrovi]|uniref:DUF58 domain-containing protein n=1 Tax=Bacillus solimangrovi TaxID=1305675 RepID=A0A1E5LD10_9BACI|nr:DUF58 domain-containing protein [Bacillus solimangrovi]OEH91964.1 hypothetical protein BFG57_17410 [Bacillus solimangrovi]
MKEFLSKWQTVKGAAFIVGIGTATYAYAMFQGGFVSWFLFYTILPFLVYMIGLYFYPLSDIKAARIIEDKHYMVNDEMTVQIELKRKFPFPLYYILVKEVLPHSLSHNTQPKKMKLLWVTRTLRFSYTIDELPRGDHRLLHLQIRTGEILGLIEKEKRVFTQSRVLVYPHIQTIKIPELLKGFGEKRANSSLYANEKSSLTSSIRSYQAGDRFSWIDWKASARTNELLTREFDKEENLSYMLYLDRTPSEVHDDFEESITYAASFVQATLRQLMEVGLTSVGESRKVFSVARGEHHFQKIYSHLAAVQSDSRIPYSQVIVEEVEQVARNAKLVHVFVIQKASVANVPQLQELLKRRVRFLVVISSLDPSQEMFVQSLRKSGVLVYWKKEKKVFL